MGCLAALLLIFGAVALGYYWDNLSYKDHIFLWSLIITGTTIAGVVGLKRKWKRERMEETFVQWMTSQEWYVPNAQHDEKMLAYYRNHLEEKARGMSEEELLNWCNANLEEGFEKLKFRDILKGIAAVAGAVLLEDAAEDFLDE